MEWLIIENVSVVTATNYSQLNGIMKLEFIKLQFPK